MYAVHMRDVAVNLLKVMHTPALSSHVCKSIALATQAVLQTVHDASRRMKEIRQLTHPDVYTREVTAAALSTHATMDDNDEDLEKLVRIAAKARVNHLENEWKDRRRGGPSRGRWGRGRGRRGGRHWSNDNSHESN